MTTTLSPKQFVMLKYILRHNGVDWDIARTFDQRTLRALYFRKMLHVGRDYSFTVTSTAIRFLDNYRDTKITRKVIKSSKIFVQTRKTA